MADLAINAKTWLREDERCRSNPLGTALPWSSTVTWTVFVRWKSGAPWVCDYGKPIENIGKTVELLLTIQAFNFLGDGNSLDWENSIISLKMTKNSAMRTEIHKKKHRGKCLNLYHWQCAFQENNFCEGKAPRTRYWASDALFCAEVFKNRAARAWDPPWILRTKENPKTFKKGEDRKSVV